MNRLGTQRERAFTLLELLLGMGILALVITSVYSALRVGMESYRLGQYKMELYQSGRMALRRVTEELRFALSPFSFWHPSDVVVPQTYEDMLASFGGMVIQEEDPGAIRFMGEVKSVLFVRKIYQLNRYPPFDLQECRIRVDSDSKQLRLEVVRSLLAVKQATWYYQYLFKVNLAGRVIPFQGGRVRFRQIGSPDDPPLMNFIGDYGVTNKVYLLAEGITDINFRYTDGQGWNSQWDSQTLITDYRISPQSANFNQIRDTRMREKGPPLVVEVQMKLENGDTLTTSTDVPAGNMQGLGAGSFGVSAGPSANPAVRPGSESPTSLPRARR